jgi:hypothetical protein
MGYLMEFMHSRHHATLKQDFVAPLKRLAPECYWIGGVWPFSATDHRDWNKIQNVPQDIMTLASYLIGAAKKLA